MTTTYVLSRALIGLLWIMASGKMVDAATAPAPSQSTLDLIRTAQAQSQAAAFSAQIDVFGTPSPSVRQAYQESLVARFQEDTYREQHVKWVYDLQYWASWTILILVVATVSAGLAFSIMQARIALTSIEAAARAATLNNTTLVLSPQRIEITSSVLGTVTLVVSGLFLWLYLQAVYPVTSKSAAPAVSTSPIPH